MAGRLRPDYVHATLGAARKENVQSAERFSRPPCAVHRAFGRGARAAAAGLFPSARVPGYHPPSMRV